MSEYSINDNLDKAGLFRADATPANPGLADKNRANLTGARKLEDMPRRRRTPISPELLLASRGVPFNLIAFVRSLFR
jgi:hypothetical protein